MKFGNAEFVRAAGEHILGVKTTQVDDRLVWVGAGYFTPGFEITTVEYSQGEGLLFPDDGKRIYVANEKSASFDGAVDGKLWSSVSDEHTNARAQSGQVMADGTTLFYIQNCSNKIDRYDLAQGTRLQSRMTSIGNRIEDFLLMSGKRIATIELDDGSDLSASNVLRTYQIQGDGTLGSLDEKPIGSPYMYGLCELDGRILMVAPHAKVHPGFASMPDGPGIYSAEVCSMGGIGSIEKDDRFSVLPGDVRSLSKLSLDGQLTAMAVTTFGYNRSKPLGGETTGVYVLPLK